MPHDWPWQLRPGGMPALKDNASGSIVSASTVGSSTIASGRGVAGVGDIGVDGAIVLRVIGVSGDLSTLDALSALSNMSNLAFASAVVPTFQFRTCFYSLGWHQNELCDLDVIYSCRTAGDASDGRLEKGTSFGRYSVKLGFTEICYMLFLQRHAMEEWDRLVAHLPPRKALIKLQSTPPSQDKLSGIWGGCSFTFHHVSPARLELLEGFPRTSYLA